MSDFYGNLQSTALKLLAKFGQGSVSYLEPGVSIGTEWEPVVGQCIEHTLDATVSGVGSMYRGSTLVRESDLVVITAPFSVTPELSGSMMIDGKPYEIVMIEAKPGAGTVIAWRIVVRA